MGTIVTFAQRQKAEYIYNTYFDPNSEHVIDFGLFDTLNFYGAITQKEFNELTDKFEKIDIKYTSTNNFYNINYLEYDNYTFNVNIVSIRFINNFSSKQENNKILINKFTNNNKQIKIKYANQKKSPGQRPIGVLEPLFNPLLTTLRS